MVCVHCGGEVPEGARYCTHCGRELEARRTEQMDTWANTYRPDFFGSEPQKKGGKGKLKYVFIGAGLLAALVVAIGIGVVVVSLGKREQEARQAAELKEEQLARRERAQEEADRRALKEAGEENGPLADIRPEDGDWGSGEEGPGGSSGTEEPPKGDKPFFSGSTEGEDQPQIQSETFYAEEQTSGIILKDTMTFYAVEDVIFEMVERVDVDLTDIDEDTRELLFETYDRFVEEYQSVEGVECTGARYEYGYIMDITIDTTKDAAQELADMGLIELIGDSEKLSLKETREALENNGYRRIR
ncbi:MAG: DUF1307 domain-containing protein [Lachnospiraceae bacterium]|nr:DUF1307 domain-containing protein [Lachnospiraceae bacterium]